MSDTTISSAIEYRIRRFIEESKTNEYMMIQTINGRANTFCKTNVCLYSDGFKIEDMNGIHFFRFSEIIFIRRARNEIS